jgi:hypothetical protein
MHHVGTKATADGINHAEISTISARSTRILIARYVQSRPAQATFCSYRNTGVPADERTRLHSHAINTWALHFLSDIVLSVTVRAWPTLSRSFWQLYHGRTLLAYMALQERTATLI